MEEKNIKEIFFRHLVSVGEQEIEMAMVATLFEAVKTILDQLLKDTRIDENHLTVVKLAIEAKSGLCVEMPINFRGVTVLVPGGSPEAFLNIYCKFDAIVQFLNSNLKNLKFGQYLSKEGMRGNLNQLVGYTRSRLEQLKGDGGGVSSADETESISYLLDMAIQLILGEEMFVKFIKDTDSIKLVLEKIKSQFVISKSSNAQNKRKPS